MTADALLSREVARRAADASAPVALTIYIDGLESKSATRPGTVAAALKDLGIVVNDADFVTPARNATVSSGMHIFITHAKRIELQLEMNAERQPLLTQEKTVESALIAAGYALIPQDRVFPSRTTVVRDGMLVELVMIRDEHEVVDMPIGYATHYEYDATLAKGVEVVEVAGADGALHREYSVRRLNGREISRRVLSESVVAPTDAIITLGTYVAAPPQAQTATESPQCVQTMTVWSTYYTASSAGGNTTRTGTGVYKGIVAVDPRVIPLGTRMYVPGYGYALAADTGGGVKGAWLDVAYGADETIDWYSHYVDICILG